MCDELRQAIKTCSESLHGALSEEGKAFNIGHGIVYCEELSRATPKCLWNHDWQELGYAGSYCSYCGRPQENTTIIAKPYLETVSEEEYRLLTGHGR